VSEQTKTDAERVAVIFTREDANELYFIINSRGESATRRKLIGALEKLDAFLANRIDAR
jgi:hypothetical protein